MIIFFHELGLCYYVQNLSLAERWLIQQHTFFFCKHKDLNLSSIIHMKKPSMLVCVCNLRTWEAERETDL